MPFTFSHPAIILPLLSLPKKWISITGLVIGTLTPDFEYFLRMKVKSNYSHTLYGVLWFDLPLAIFIAFLFHNLIRNGLYNNLPQTLKTRLLNFNEFNWNKYFKENWFIVTISIIIGVASHLFWDNFTHKSGYFVVVLPQLSEQINILGYLIPFFKILQHASSLLGALIIGFTFYKLPIQKSITIPLNWKYWIMLVFISLIIILIRILCGLDLKQYGHTIVSLISALIIALAVTPLFVKQINNIN